MNTLSNENTLLPPPAVRKSMMDLVHRMLEAQRAGNTAEAKRLAKQLVLAAGQEIQRQLAEARAVGDTKKVRQIAQLVSFLRDKEPQPVARIGYSFGPIIVQNFQKRLTAARAAGNAAEVATLLATMKQYNIPTSYVPIAHLDPRSTAPAPLPTAAPSPVGSPYPYVSSAALPGAHPSAVTRAGDTVRFHGRPASVWDARTRAVSPSVLTTPNRYGTVDGAGGFTRANGFPNAVDARVLSVKGDVLEAQVIGFTYANGNYQPGSGAPGGSGGLFAAVPLSQVSHVWRDGKLLV